MKMLACFALLAAAGVTLWAHQERPQPPVFTSGVDLVRLDVRVTDGTGRPVTDLRSEDLQVIEDGTARPLLFFQHVQEPAGTYQEAALRALSAEVSSNQGTPRGHLYILLSDQHHIAPGHEQTARRAAETFVTTRLRPSDRVAIFGLPGPGPQLGFTADRARAISELAKVRGELEGVTNTAAGRFTIEEAYEIAAGNDRVISDVIARRAGDLTGDAGSSQGTSGPLRLERASQRLNEDPSTTRKIIVEDARTLA